MKSHKMVKHTQKIRQLLPTNCLSVLDHFVKLALKGLSKITKALITQVHNKQYHKNLFKQIERDGVFVLIH